jgi:hypothetical protein
VPYPKRVDHPGTMKTIHVTIKVQIESDADAHETIQECDYSMTGEGIIGTEIISVTDEHDVSVF